MTDTITPTIRAHVKVDWPFNMEQFARRSRRIPINAKQLSLTINDAGTHATYEYEWPTP